MQPYEKLGIKCWGRDYFLPKDGSVSECTHLLLNGGNLRIPMKDELSYERDFLIPLGQDIAQGNPNFVCEQRTPVFRMHTDLDILLDTHEEEASFLVQNGSAYLIGPTLLEWIAEMQKVMGDFFSQAPGFKPKLKHRNLCGCQTTGQANCQHTFDRLSAVVCLSRPKGVIDTVDKKSTKTKIGVHIIWPFVLCRAKTAQKIWGGWVQHFERKYGKRPHNRWEVLFDESIYIKNGLRMVGSDKMAKCPTCKGRKSKTGLCPANRCDGISGQYPEQRPYRVAQVVKFDGLIDKRATELATRSPIAELLWTHIRCPTCLNRKPHAPNDQCPKCVSVTSHLEQLPKWYDEHFYYDRAEQQHDPFNPSRAQRVMQRKKILDMQENKEGEELFFNTKSGQCVSKTRLPSEDTRVQAIQDWIKSTGIPEIDALPECYRNVNVIDVKQCSCMGSGEFPFYFVRVDSSFCLNVGREHQSNSIFFLINENGLYQKCFCTCNNLDGRFFGLCRDFAYGPYKMPDAVRRELYPALYARYTYIDELGPKELQNLDEEDRDEINMLTLKHLDQEWEIHNARIANKMHDKRFRSKRKY